MSKEDDSPECEWALRFREYTVRRNRLGYKWRIDYKQMPDTDICFFVKNILNIVIKLINYTTL